MQDHFLFVYGTLMKGYGNHGFLNHDGVTFIGRGKSKNHYLMTASGIPYVHSFVRKHQIHGEIYKVSNQIVMNAIDRLEGHPFWYTRTPIDIILDNGDDIIAEIYFNKNPEALLALQTGEQHIVETGDYRNYVRNYFTFDDDDINFDGQ